MCDNLVPFHRRLGYLVAANRRRSRHHSRRPGRCNLFWRSRRRRMLFSRISKLYKTFGVIIQCREPFHIYVPMAAVLSSLGREVLLNWRWTMRGGKKQTRFEVG